MARQPKSPPATTSQETDSLPDDVALTWGTAAYREWVQSQISDKLFWKFTRVGAGTFLIAVAAYFGLQNFVLNSVQNAVAIKVEAALDSRIADKVSAGIADQPALIKSATSQAVEQATVAIEQFVESEQFADQTSTRLLAILDESGGPQDIVLTEALNRARDPSAPDGIRALGLELYTLLHAGKRTSDTVQPMREMIAQIVTSHTPESPLPAELVSAVLEHYTLGDYNPTDPLSECFDSVIICETWDNRIVLGMLHILEDRSHPITDSESVKDFFARTTARQVDTILQWLPRASTATTGTIARDLLVSVVTADNRDVLTRILPPLATLAIEQDHTQLRNIALAGLASLDHQASVDRDVRRTALDILWFNATDAELESAFSTATSSTTDIPIDFPLSPADTADTASPVGDAHRRALLLRSSVIALLRTSPHGPSGQRINDPHGENDWDNILRPLSERRPDHLFRAHTAWVERMKIDLRRSLDVAWAADRVFAELPSGFLSDDLAHAAAEFAVSLSSDASFVEFSSHYVATGEFRSLSPGAVAFAATLTERDARSATPSGWISAMLKEATPNERFLDYWLDALVAHYARASVAKDGHDRLTRAGALARTFADGPGPRLAIARLIVDDLLRRLEQDNRHWDVVAALEDARLLEVLDEFPALQATLHWMGTPLDSDYPLITADQSPVRLTAHQEDDVRAAGGAWYSVDISAHARFTVEHLPHGTEIVIMDATRSVSVARATARQRESDFEASLAPGLYAVALRLHELPTQSIDVVLALSPSKGPFPLSPGRIESPERVSRSLDYLFDSGPDSGEAWLAISLERGSILGVRTRNVTQAEASAQDDAGGRDSRPSPQDELDPIVATRLRVLFDQIGRLIVESRSAIPRAFEQRMLLYIEESLLALTNGPRAPDAVLTLQHLIDGMSFLLAEHTDRIQPALFWRLQEPIHETSSIVRTIDRVGLLDGSISGDLDTYVQVDRKSVV